MQSINEHIRYFLQRRRSTRFKELQRVLFEVGFEMRQQKRGGSHYVFKHLQVPDLVVLVSHGANDVLPEYQLMKAVKALRELKE